MRNEGSSRFPLRTILSQEKILFFYQRDRCFSKCFTLAVHLCQGAAQENEKQEAE